MALQPCEQVNNIHEGIIYRKTFSYTNSTSSPVKWKNYLYWLNGQVNALLNSLPDGYYFRVITLLGHGVEGSAVYETTGSSHNATYNVCYPYLSYVSGGYDVYMYRLQPDVNYCHHGELTVSTSNVVNMNDKTEETAVAANATRNADIEYVLYKINTNTPTQ